MCKKNYLVFTLHKLVPCENSCEYHLIKTHQAWLCMKISPKMPSWYWLSTLLFLGETTEKCSFVLCNETILDCVYLWGETNKDNYCQRILFIPCAVCLWRINMLQPELVGLLGQSASSFMLFIIPCKTALSNSYCTVGPSDATASRTKLCISGLKPCVWALGFKLKKKKNRKGRKRKDGRGGEGEGERGEERLQQWASTARVPY